MMTPSPQQVDCLQIPSQDSIGALVRTIVIWALWFDHGPAEQKTVPLVPLMVFF